jgi:hypothetical protein
MCARIFTKWLALLDIFLTQEKNKKRQQKNEHGDLDMIKYRCLVNVTGF